MSRHPRGPFRQMRCREKDGKRAPRSNTTPRWNPRSSVPATCRRRSRTSQSSASSPQGHSLAAPRTSPPEATRRSLFAPVASLCKPTRLCCSKPTPQAPCGQCGRARRPRARRPHARDERARNGGPPHLTSGIRRDVPTLTAQRASMGLVPVDAGRGQRQKTRVSAASPTVTGPAQRASW